MAVGVGSGKLWQANNKELLTKGLRKCSNCFEVKSLDDFSMYSNRVHYRSQCKSLLFFTCHASVYSTSIRDGFRRVHNSFGYAR